MSHHSDKPADLSRQSIPLLDLRAQYAAIKDEVRLAIDHVLESQHFILGPEVEALEQEVAAYSGCRFGIGVSSGTDALLAALMAIGIKPGDEVITTPYTFFAIPQKSLPSVSVACHSFDKLRTSSERVCP